MGGSDSIGGWLLKIVVAGIIAVGVYSLGMAALHSEENSNYAADLNQIVSLVAKQYPSQPYTAAGQQDATASLLSTGEIPASWGQANGNDAYTPWSSLWSFQLAANNLVLEVQGIPYDSCKSIVPRITRFDRLNTVTVNNNDLAVATIAQTAYSGNISDLASYCTAGSTNDVKIKLQ